MTKSDFNRLSGERRGGLMNELVTVRDGVVENAWLKAKAAALAMDPTVTQEIDDHSRMAETAVAHSVQAPAGADTPPAAYAGTAFPMQQLGAEKNMLTEEDDSNTQLIDRLAAEANVERAFATTNGDDYELAA